MANTLAIKVFRSADRFNSGLMRYNRVVYIT